MNKQQMQQRLETIQAEAEAIKQALAKSYPVIQEANPGDELEDGTIVIAKYPNAALIAAPESTEVRCKWSKEFQPVFDKLSEEGFNPSQWFIPSVEQLKLAYEVAKQYFSSPNYWSSTEVLACCACTVFFNNGYQVTYSKTTSNCVRAFRLVSF